MENLLSLNTLIDFCCLLFPVLTRDFNMSKRLPQTMPKISSYFVKRNRTEDTEPASSAHSDETQTPSVESLELEDSHSSVLTSDCSSSRIFATEANTNDARTEAPRRRQPPKSGGGANGYRK